MRILFIHGERSAGGGAESLLHDQAEGLKRLGHETAWWYGQGSLQAAIDEFEPDICHLMTLHCYPMGLTPAVYLQEHKIPHVWHIQDYWPFCKGRMLMVNGDKSCSAVKGICQHECGEYVDYLEIVNQSFVIAGNSYTAEIYKRNGLRCDAVVELGIDTELFKPGERELGTIYTSCAWPDGKWKGMHVLREALIGIPYSAKLISGVPRAVVAEELKKADIYIFPSCYEETFGLCLCEAMASGCAIIASDVAGARAQVHAGMGLLVPPRDVLALRQAVDELTRNPKKRENMGSLAREHVQSEHTLEAMSKRWLAVYQGVYNGN